MLLEHVRAERPDLATRLRLLIEIAEAVAFAHRNFVVHRDLKPLNVIVDREGHPHLLDFGIARLLGDSDEETLTRTGVRPLSPGYAAPEQLRGDDVGTAADVYALGVIGYELLCGARPFDRQGGLERILRDLVSERLRMPSEVVATTLGDEALRPPLQRKRLARELQGDLDTILVRALAAQPERRYATASDFADDIARYLDGQPIRARPDTGLVSPAQVRAAPSNRGRDFGQCAARAGARPAGRAGAGAARQRRARPRAGRARFHARHGAERQPLPGAQPGAPGRCHVRACCAQSGRRSPDDPEIEATLLQQFGRSLLVLERGDAAAEALERAERLLAGHVPDTHALLVEVRGRLVDLYRLQRNFARSGALAEAQFALCDDDTVLKPLQCLGIRNDRIETSLFSGHPARALLQVQEARAFATAAQLDDDYESVFVDYLDGMARRQLGDTGAAADALLRLAERTLATVPAQHPGLLTDMMWLGAIALDLGNTELAERCVEHALAGRSALYAPGSRYVHEARLLRAQVAVAADDPVRARSELSTILAFRDAQHGSESTPMTLAATWLALLDAVPPADSRTAAGAGGAVLNVDDNSARATELRLLQAMIAITRGDLATARRLRDEVGNDAEGTPTPHWRPLADLVAARIAEAAGDTVTALALRARIDTELGRQCRRLFDPVAGRWLGQSRRRRRHRRAPAGRRHPHRHRPPAAALSAKRRRHVQLSVPPS